MNDIERTEIGKKIKEYDKLQKEINDLSNVLTSCTEMCVEIQVRLGGCKADVVTEYYVSEIAVKMKPIIAGMIYEREQKRDRL